MTTTRQHRPASPTKPALRADGALSTQRSSTTTQGAKSPATTKAGGETTFLGRWTTTRSGQAARRGRSWGKASASATPCALRRGLNALRCRAAFEVSSLVGGAVLSFFRLVHGAGVGADLPASRSFDRPGATQRGGPIGQSRIRVMRGTTDTERKVGPSGLRISDVFAGRATLPYETAVSRLVASGEPLLGERKAMDQLDLAELTGEVVIERTRALVHLLTDREGVS